MKTLVLLHAFPFDSKMWVPQLAAFPDYRIVAPNLLGESIDAAPAKVIADLESLGIAGKVVLGGLSMGGYMALAFSRQFPERLAGLILADTKAAADDDAAKAARQKAIDIAKAEGSAGIARMMLPKLLGETTRKTDPDLVETVQSMIARQPAEKVLAAIAALRDRPDATPGLKAIAAPTLVIVGNEDSITPPAMAQILVDAIPRATLRMISAAGHLTNLETPAEFNRAVAEFLNALN